MIGLLFVVVLLATGCGSTSDDAAKAIGDATSVSYPVTITSGGRTTVIDDKPDRIVSLSPTATEDLFAIQAGGEVVAVDEQSTYPPTAPRKNLSGFTPNAEAVLGYTPDLVVIQADANGLVAALEAAKVDVLIQPSASTIDDIYKQLADLGAVTDHAQQALDTVNVTRQLIRDKVARAGTAGQGKTYYHEVDNTLYSSTSRTFIGSVYNLFGLKNIADTAATGGNEYPQLSSEFVVKANPDYVFLADTKFGESKDTVAKRPGWADLAAVKNNHVVALDDDIASRWSPRVAELVGAVGTAVAGP